MTGQAGVDVLVTKGQISITDTTSTTTTGFQDQFTVTEIDQKVVPIPGQERWTYIFNTPSEPVARTYGGHPVRAREGWRITR